MGEGPPLVSWAAGTITAASVFDEPRSARMQRELATFTRRVNLDRRGMGYSDPLPIGEPHTLEHQALDVLAVLDALEIDEAVVVGAGWEAQGVLHLAANRPERVSKVVLISMTPRLMGGPDWEHGISPELVMELGGQFDRPGENSTPHIQELLAPSVADDVAFWTWVNAAGRVPPATARAYVESGIQTDARALLPQISAPTLILHNAHDSWTPVGAVRYMAEQIPDARLVEYDSADHIFITTHLTEKIAEIESFVAEPDRAHAQRRLLTVLFTDVVGSTERLAGTPDAR